MTRYPDKDCTLKNKKTGSSLTNCSLNFFCFLVSNFVQLSLLLGCKQALPAYLSPAVNLLFIRISLTFNS